MKIVVLGASGLLGSVLVPKLILSGNEVTTIGRSSTSQYQCNVGNIGAISGILDAVMPDVIINLIALTDVDYCEQNPNQAFVVNVKTLENVVTWIKKSIYQCHLVQFSTDQVYDSVGPHFEDNVVLSNYYAFSKYAAELVALRVQSTILRTNFFGKSNCNKKTSFTDWLYTNISNKEELFLFSDVFFSPLSMTTLSEVVLKILEVKPKGIFNLGSRDGLSKSDFASLFAQKLNLEVHNAIVTSIDDATFIKSYRPKDMRMSVSKIENYLDIIVPTLEEEIDKTIGDYKGIV